MYKCSYCDSIFMEYYSNCPNCGGSCWLTNKKSELPVKPDPCSKDTEEVTVVKEDEAEIKLGNHFRDIFTVIFTAFIIVAALCVIVTSGPARDIFMNIYQIINNGIQP